MLNFLSQYILGTPDFGHSDIWHQNFAFAFHLSQALKAGYFPFWVKDIGMGFPMLADGEMGMFYPPNILLFRFFNPILAFNLSYVLVLITLLVGSYLYAWAIKLSRLSSVFFTFIFSFSGLIITQLRSIHIVQAMSFMPWEFYLVEKYLTTQKKRWLLLFSLTLALQIYANYQQIVLISLIGVGIYSLFRLRQTKSYFGAIPIILATISGLILALPQILPTAQLVRLSSRTSGVGLDEMLRFVLNPKQLLQFLNPYIWGDPRHGTYPTFSNDWGIFWESTGYIGILPLILAVLAFKNKKYSALSRIYLIILVVSFILLLSRYTPFFFLFQLPPFSFFRVPSRFLLLFIWSLALLATFGLDRIKNKQFVWAIIAVSFLDLGYFSLSYHTFIKATDWLNPPKSVTFLKNDQSWYRVYTITPYKQWNEIFLTRGWQDMSLYRPFRNALDPNQNLFWNIPSEDSYTGLSTRRAEIWQSLLGTGIRRDLTNNTTSISSESAKLLSLAGVKYLIISEKLLTLPGTYLSPITTTSASPAFTIYQNKVALPHAYLTQDFTIVKDLPELVSKLIDPAEKAAVLEKNLPITSVSGPIKEAKVSKNEDLEVDVTTKADQESILVLTDSYYPNWIATVNGNSTSIFPVNLNQRGVLVPKGESRVVFRYRWL